APQPDLSGVLFNDPAAPAAPATPAAPQPSERELDLERQLLEEKARNQQLTAEQQQQLEHVNNELSELRQFKNNIELERQINLDGIDFQTIDPAVAREIAEKLVKPVLGRQKAEYETQLQKTQQQLEAERAERLRRDAERTDRQKTERLESINRKITEAHPDFTNVRNSVAFSEFLAQPVRAGSKITMAQAIGHEYHNGNAQFVIDALSEFKQSRPDLAAFAAAGVSTVASQPAVNLDEPDFTYADLEQWNMDFATGRMKRDEYTQKKAAFDKAEAEGRVK
ncbi:MAG: hypothetical protein E7G41_06410, partial [Bifidobacterium sp.]|nr:hypothetical protein [Bifidobacterium sp.]